MSKDQDLVSLTMSILDKPPRRYKIDTDGVFKEDQEQISTWEEYFKLQDLRTIIYRFSVVADDFYRE